MGIEREKKVCDIGGFWGILAQCFPIVAPPIEDMGKHKQEIMVTTAIVFDHRGRTKKGENGPLEVRLTVNRRPYYINTGVRVRARQWAFNQVIDHPQSDVLNERLAIILKRVNERVNDALKHGTEINVTQIRNSLWTSSHSDNFLEWMRDELGMLPVREGTLKHYRSLVYRLEEFGAMAAWQDVTTENIYKFDAWLRALPGRVGEKMTGGGVYNYHKCLRALLGRAEKSGQIQANPYHRLRGEFSKGDRENTEYLTEEEMQRIENLKPTPGTWMEKARDLFVFQMYTGLAFSDAQAFDISDYRLVDGKWRKIGTRIKTGKPFVSQLLPPVVEVLKKYDYKVPKLWNETYNRELKHVGMAAGISTRLHSHLARHTFATYMLRHGVKIENLAKMLGHANIKQTQRYAKVLAESVHEDFDMIEQQMKKSD